MTIADRITEIIWHEIEHPDIKILAHRSDASLQDDLGIDGLGILNIGMMIEDEFEIVIADETLHAWQTVGDIARSVEKRK